MINVSTFFCTGCSACFNICPKRCINMSEDTEGFLYPQVDTTRCIDCGLCEKVCPALEKHNHKRSPLQIYVGYNIDKAVLLNSSSGGVFTLLAQQIILAGGVVFGAKFNDQWEVVHDYTETIDGLVAFQGSKYVQSRVGHIYCQVKSFLKEGRQVLFSGTPCQIAGLRRFLRKSYDNLLTVDFICHGVPSPGIWKQYLNEIIIGSHDGKSKNDNTHIGKISFRNKRIGWKRYSFFLEFIDQKNSRIINEPLDENDYLRGFIANLYLRPSCHHCNDKGWSSGSDITIADAWGIWEYIPDFDDDKGCSIISVLTLKGEQILQALKESGMVCVHQVEEDFIRKYNPAAFVSAKAHKKRKAFFKYIRIGKNFHSVINACLPQPTYFDKIIWSIKKRLKNYVK